MTSARRHRASYSTVEVAKRLGVSLQTVQRWVDSGRLKAWKTPGGHRRVDAESAEQLFRSQDDRLGPAAAPARPLRALVADDDPLDREILKDIVRRLLPGVDVEAAPDGSSALMAIGRSDPDLVIADIHMPHINGIEMIRRVLAGGRSRVIVAVSALPADELPDLKRLPPSVGFLPKPVDDVRLAALLRPLVAPPPG